MPLRRPAVAGRFYPGDGKTCRAEIGSFLAPFAGAEEDAPAVLMVPHAGWVFSGRTVAATLAGVRLPETLVVLCPNHTGRGHPLGVWSEGAWRTPLGDVAVDAELADALLARGLFAADAASHLREHSIEVELPFLQVLGGERVPRIVPVCVGTAHPRVLEDAGGILAEALGPRLADGTAGVLVSSDMNHYEDHETTLRKDMRALECVLAEDPGELLLRCARERITMCGAAPMAVALHALRALRGGARPSAPARLVAHTTSGETFGDREHTVGYAGVRLHL